MDRNESLLPELKLVKNALAGAGIPWGVAAGAAVYLYAGNRPPTDLDVLVPPQDLPRASHALGIGVKMEKTSWGETEKVATGRVEIVGRLTVMLEGGSHQYCMDEEMVEHLRLVTLEGIEVPVLAPEDLIALKVVLRRGPEQGKHDLEDVAALVARVPVDRAYLQLRLQRMDATERARPIVERM